jgi:hypothetical protein
VISIYGLDSTRQEGLKHVLPLVTLPNLDTPKNSTKSLQIVVLTSSECSFILNFSANCPHL